MEGVLIKKTFDNQGQVSELEISGTLILDYSQQLKNGLVGIMDRLAKRLNIRIYNVESIDLSCLQLILAFIRYMDENHVVYHFEWDIDEYQRELFVNVGLANELYLE